MGRPTPGGCGGPRTNDRSPARRAGAIDAGRHARPPADLSLADASTLAEAPLDGAIVDDLALAADGRTALTTHLLARKTDGHMALVRRWDLAASSGG
jgi:hypothetical protein